MDIDCRCGAAKRQSFDNRVFRSLLLRFKRGMQPSQTAEDAVRWGRRVQLVRTGTVSAGKKTSLEKQALFPRGFGKHQQKGLRNPTARCQPICCPLLLGTSEAVMQVYAVTNAVLMQLQAKCPLLVCASIWHPTEVQFALIRNTF